MAKKDTSHYISAKESRRISRENNRTVRLLEKKKRRKHVPESEYLTTMRDPHNIVEFDDLHTFFFTDAGVVKAVNGVSFDIPEHSVVGVVGESGCGKSITSMSLMQLVQAPQGQIVSGSIRFRSDKRIPDGEEPMTVSVTEQDGTVHEVPKLDAHGKPRMRPKFRHEEQVVDIAKLPLSEMQHIRGREISMIFQEPMTSLNPVFTIGYQLDEVTLLHTPGATKEDARERSLEMLKMVGIAMPERVYKSYPHELSGGMRQRVMIAIAIACNPRLIIADEPTTALDVTIQAQVLNLLRELKQKLNSSILLITHDLGVICEMADYVVVMYAGRIVEKGTMREIFKEPAHPYTIGLHKSKPNVREDVDRLFSIPGQVPNPIDMPTTCYFRDRCDRCCEKCNGDYPEMVQLSPTHFVACHRAKEIYEENKKKQGGGIRKLGSASGKVGTTLKKVGGKIAHGVLYAAGFTYLVGQELTKKKPEAETKPENTEKEAGKNG